MANSEMLNREVFQNDPVKSYLANNGVAKVSEEKNPEAIKDPGIRAQDLRL